MLNMILRLALLVSFFVTFPFHLYSQVNASASSLAPSSVPSSRFDAYSIFFNREYGSFFGSSLGITTFGNQTFYAIGLSPELALGSWGIGLDVNLRISQQGQLRQEDWQDGISSYLRLIRYVRYNFKRDSLYFRFGQLDAVRLGHGSILFLYRNNASYDARRMGIEFDADFGDFGFESVIGDVSTFHVLGLRPFWRPLRSSGLALLSGLELGATFVGDFHPDANVRVSSGMGTSGASFDSLMRGGQMLAFGLDIGLPLVRLPMLDVDFFLDVAGLAGYGAGVSVGVSGALKNLLNMLVLSAKLEQRLLTRQFQFAYFDALYEQDRYREHLTGIVTRATALSEMASGGAGIYGEMGGSVLDKLKIFGAYQRFYRTPRDGILQLSMRLEDLIPSVVFRADYFKRDVGADTDLFTLDERSLLHVEFSYLPYPYLLLSVVYQWTFIPVRGENNRILRYEPLQRIEPRVALHLQF
jgi:hypothetical protein